MKLKYISIAAIFSITLLFFLGNFFVAVHRMDFGGDSGNIVAYVRGDEPLRAILLPEEALHLEDVKSLISGIFMLFYVLTACSLVLLAMLLLKSRRALLNVLLYSGISVLALCVILALLSLDFDPFFTVFHRIFFPGGNWVFPVGTKLVTAFNEEFFRRFFGRLLFNVAIQAVTIILIAAPGTTLYARIKSRFDRQFYK
jgi:hypothetical protein